MADDPKIDIFPDGWGMKIDPNDNLSPEEARELIKGIEDLNAGRVRSLEEIEKDLREKGN
jgi:hypothetical protein